MLYNINVKFLEILTNLIHEQNMQLLQIISEEEKLNYREVVKDIPSRFELKRMMDNLNTNSHAPTPTRNDALQHEQHHRREVKSNSTSESSVPPPDSEDE